MKIEELSKNDIDLIVPFYVKYYNTHEEGCWTEETAEKRIRQVLDMEGAFSLVLKDDREAVCGFAMGYFKQYDDIVGYTLEEIVIAKEYQNQGLGSKLLATLEEMVWEAGASCVELQAVNDEKHEHYYGKAGYRNVKNFVMKVKWFYK